MKRGVRGVTKSLRTLSTIYVFCEDCTPLATCVSTMPLQKIPPSDNIIFFAEMDGHLRGRGATFGFFRSFDLRLKSGL